MAGPATLTVRAAVRAGLADLPAGALVLVACSGGPDSLALAAAAAWVAPRTGRRAGAVVVDHGLQPGAAERSASTAAALRTLALEPVEVRAVRVARGPGSGGPEAAARAARYPALAAAAAEHRADAVLLGHTRDDQAETVLLGLARGSGARSLAGMAAAAGLWRRPLLDLDRATVRAAAEEAGRETGVPPWQDPHNTDPAFTRARVRAELLPALEAVLPGATAALARSARLLRDDADALDALAATAAGELVRPGPDGDTAVDAEAVARLPRAVRTRLLRRVLVDAGAAAGELTAAHVEAVEALVTAWRGQGRVDVPGRVGVTRACGRLHVRTRRPAVPE